MRKNRKRLLAGLLCAVVLMADFAPVGVRVSAAEQEAGQSAESELWSETDDRGTEESAAETRIEESATEEKEDGTGTEASAVEEKEDETGTETSKEAETESESTVKSTETDTEDVETEDNSLTETETEVDTESAELAEEEAPTSGTCGANLTWKLEDGTLTISGTGAMEDYNYYNYNNYYSPWHDNRDKINQIVVCNGVTSIGNYAFYYCSSLTEITISDSVTYIGSYAFSGCTSLTGIAISNSVTRIGNGAFLGCSSLTGVYISSIESWCNIAFGANYANPLSGGTNLYVNENLVKDLIIPDSVTSIASYVFCGSSLTSIIIPDSVTSIDKCAFEGCSGLTSITIPDSVTSIGDGAFYGCSSLTEITIPNGVTSIDKDAFKDCNSLTSITIPDSVTSIGSDAFSYCNNLTNVYISSIESWCNIEFYSAPFSSSNGRGKLYLNGNLVENLIIPNSVTEIKDGAFYGCASITSVTIPDSVISIGGVAFKNCRSLTSVIIPDSVTSIGSRAFEYCYGLTGVYISSIESWCNIEFKIGGIGHPEANPLVYARNLYINGNLVNALTIPDSITQIKDGAFYGCSSITSVTIPASVTSIGRIAFDCCSNLTSVTIPASVTSSGYCAFSGCSSLTEVYISSIESWCNIEFDGGDGNPLRNGANLYVNGNLVKDLIIPDGVTNIGDCTFYGSSLTGITIPSSVTSIGKGAFGGCDSLASIAIPNSVTDIGDSAFAGCSSLAGITIPSRVTRIKDNTFWGCSNLTGITIPVSVTRIGYHAFENCSNLTDVYYSGSEDDWKAIYKDYDNDALFSANIHYNMSTDLSWSIDINGVLSIYGMGEMADYNNSDFPVPWSSQRDKIKKVIIGQFVTSIGASAFAGCTNLTTITIPIAVKSIGDSAFSGCSSLAEVDYIGNKTQWGIITKGTDNAPLYNAKIHYRSSDAGSDTDKTNMFLQPKQVSYYDTIHGASKTLDINWGWSLMASSSSGYNNEAAIAGLVLSGATESSQGNAEQAMKDLGFTSKLPKSVHYEKEWYEIAQPAVTFGYKHVVYDDDRDGHFFAVAVRGTTDASDMLTDVASLVGSFQTGAEFVYTELESYMIECCKMPLADIKKNGNVQFFITGHSLGGAVANITAKKLIENYSAASVTAYTFAAPPCATMSDVVFAGGYYDIYNIINEEDIVTKASWLINGLIKRNGKDIPFHRDDDSDIYTKFHTLTGKNLKELMTGWKVRDPIATKADKTFTRKLCAHSPSIYMAYLANSVTSTHRGRRIVVRCPVDVEVYAADEDGEFLVCRITDNKIDGTVPVGAYAYVDGDDKYIELLYDGDYTVKLTATDNGTMTYAVQSVDNGTNQVVDEKIYSNVVLTEGKKMTSTVSVWDKTDTSIDTADKIDTKDVQLLVLDENGEPQKEVLPDGNGTEVPVGSVLDGVLPGDIPEGGIPEGLWIAGIKDYIYTGTAIKPEIRVYDNDNRLKAGQDYIISYKNNVNANNASNTKKAPTVTVRGKGNYTGTETATFKIQPVNLNDSSILAEDICTAYTGKAQKKIPVLTCHNKKLSNNKDFTVSYPSAAPDAYKAAGTYDILLTAKQGGNYTGTRTVKLTITDSILISRAKVEKIPAQPYTGAAIEPGLKVTCNKMPLTKDRDYTAVYTSNTDVGTAAVTITGIGSYAGTKTVTFKITGISLNKASVTGIENKIYSGTAHKQNLKVVSGNKTLAEGTDYEAFYTNNINAGKATVTIKGINSYAGSIKKTFRIAPCDIGTDTENLLAGLDAAVTEKYVKGGSRPQPQLTYAGRKLTEGKDYTITYRNNRAVASAEARNAPSFTIRGKGNFKGTLTRKFSITGKALDDSESPVRLSVPDKGYSGKAGGYVSIPVLTDTDGKKLTVGTDYEKEIQYTLEDGTPLTKTDKVETGRIIRVKVTGKGAYSGGLEGVYRITENDFSKAAVTISPQT